MHGTDHLRLLVDLCGYDVVGAYGHPQCECALIRERYRCLGFDELQLPCCVVLCQGLSGGEVDPVGE